MKENNLKEVVTKMKNVENGISDIIVPMLKDTIQDYKRTFNKMFIIVILLITLLTGTIGYALFLVYKQNIQYQEFLSNFDFSSEVVQDLDSGEGDITNTTLNAK